ncbi:SAM-dependent methyltransferase [Actinoallomurus rhizosphaericola]|uniref:SAM-dependent methyltransferase n=1 Tax=Actinoallomurus rhizosphaericola TaxID=2952536 RepID=UPI00209261DB|nr:SAM-dependent methyltransferase [Actinoallomurus rhizosphaericola]MCO5996312.1 SAM-dependent methyltransferase [Actinoallomurus rhizosphaericola]
MADEEVPVHDLRTDRPTPARMYDYYLGGKDNFAVDRDAAEQVLSAAPEVRVLARENRAFLGRVVRYLAAEAGIRQFIDVGTGLPTQGNVHEVAQAVAPGARVVYVDNDPIVRAHAKALLPADGTTAIVEADMRDPGPILDHPHTRRLIRFDEPVAVLFMSVLHFITDEEDPYGLVAAFRDVSVPGSYLALSHITTPEGNADGAESAADVYKKRATSPAILRSPKEIEALFDGYDLVEPGLVNVPKWRPDDPEAARGGDSVWMLGAAARKR